MHVTHSYSIEQGRTHRRECESCHLVVTTQTVVVFVDPKYGEGAAALAKRLNGQSGSSASAED